MPELRKDPITGRWVIIATERAKRPDNFKLPAESPPEGECPFCEGKEDHTPPEIRSIREGKTSSKSKGPGWKVRVIPSIKPILRIEGKINRRGLGVYDVMDGIGAHEVIVETPQHIDNICNLDTIQINHVFEAYRERLADLEKDPRFKYVLIFKNYGWAAGGGRIKHSRSQLIATPVVPKRVKEELAGSHKYYEYHDRCVFCDMIKQELDSKARVVLDIDGFIAVTPFASRFPFEVWVLPKKHSCDFVKLEPKAIKDLSEVIRVVLSKINKGLSNPAYNYILHTAPFRRQKPGYWKTIDEDYHWHIEIMPKLTRVAGFEWGTGFYICPLPPEDAAEFLRGVEI